MVVPAGRDQSYFIAERRLGVHVVFLDREPRLFEADAVVSANHDGAAMVIDHLLAHGHRRIGYLGDCLSVMTAAERYRGYETALDRAGIAIDRSIVRHGLRSIDDAAEATPELMALDHPPTALFASQNLVTIGAVKALRRQGLEHSIALVGFDDFVLADFLVPGISVVAQDTSGLGRLAAQRLFARLDGDDSPPRTYVVPVSLIERGSGEIEPARLGSMGIQSPKRK